MFQKRIVDITTTDIGIVCGTLDGKLAFGKSDDGDGKTGMTNVNKSDMTRVLGFWEIGFGDTVTEGSGGGVVDDTENIEVGDRSGIKDSSTLDVSVPSRDGNDDIGNAGF